MLVNNDHFHMTRLFVVEILSGIKPDTRRTWATIINQGSGELAQMATTLPLSGRAPVASTLGAAAVGSRPTTTPRYVIPFRCTNTKPVPYSHAQVCHQSPMPVRNSYKCFFFLLKYLRLWYCRITLDCFLIGFPLSLCSIFHNKLEL